MSIISIISDKKLGHTFVNETEWEMEAAERNRLDPNDRPPYPIQS